MNSYDRFLQALANGMTTAILFFAIPKFLELRRSQANHEISLFPYLTWLLVGLIWAVYSVVINDPFLYFSCVFQILLSFLYIIILFRVVPRSKVRYEKYIIYVYSLALVLIGVGIFGGADPVTVLSWAAAASSWARHFTFVHNLWRMRRKRLRNAVVLSQVYVNLISDIIWVAYGFHFNLWTVYPGAIFSMLIQSGHVAFYIVDQQSKHIKTPPLFPDTGQVTVIEAHSGNVLGPVPFSASTVSFKKLERFRGGLRRWPSWKESFTAFRVLLSSPVTKHLYSTRRGPVSIAAANGVSVSIDPQKASGQAQEILEEIADAGSVLVVPMGEKTEGVDSGIGTDSGIGSDTEGPDTRSGEKGEGVIVPGMEAATGRARVQSFSELKNDIPSNQSFLRLEMVSAPDVTEAMQNAADQISQSIEQVVAESITVQQEAAISRDIEEGSDHFDNQSTPPEAFSEINEVGVVERRAELVD